MIASPSNFDSALQEAREAERQRQRTFQRHEKIVKLKTELKVSLVALPLKCICVRSGGDACSGIVL